MNFIFAEHLLGGKKMIALVFFFFREGNEMFFFVLYRNKIFVVGHF
jgi:hypothetical protein